MSSATVHGNGRSNLSVSCPTEMDGDYIVDEGDCKDALDFGFDLTDHRMEMWEVDHWRPLDDKIETILFPTLNTSVAGASCDIYGCDEGRVWSFRAKKSGTSIVSATAAGRVTGAAFIDQYGWCRDPLEDECD